MSINIKEKIEAGCDKAEEKLQEWKDGREERARKREEWINSHPRLSNVIGGVAVVGTYVAMVGGIIALGCVSAKNGSSSEGCEEENLTNYDYIRSCADSMNIPEGCNISAVFDSDGIKALKYEYVPVDDCDSDDS